MKTSASSGRIRRVLWLMSAAAVVMSIGRALYVTGQPERLAIPNIGGEIHQSSFYWVSNRSGHGSVNAMPLTTTVPRVLVEERPAVEVDNSWLRCTDTDVLYQLRPNTTTPHSVGRGLQGVSNAVFLGDFRPSNGKPLPFEKRIRYAARKLSIYLGQLSRTILVVS